MYSLTIAVGPTVWSMLFNSEKTASAQKKLVQDAVAQMGTTCVVKDDFGQELEVSIKSLHGWMYENMDDSKLAHCERALHQARLQTHVQRMAEADPGLRSSAQMRGPSIISPMMGPNGR